MQQPSTSSPDNLTGGVECYFYSTFVYECVLVCRLPNSVCVRVYSIFGKVGRIASEEVVIHLIRNKCVPILLYGLEALPLNKSQLASLNFMVNSFFMKLFKTTDMQVVKMCREHFDFALPSLQLDRRRRSFVGSPVTIDLIKLVFA